MSGFIGFLKRIAVAGSHVVQRIVSRFEKKYATPRGTTAGGAKTLRRRLYILVALIFLGIASAVLIKSGTLTPVDVALETEVAPGAKRAPDIVNGYNDNTLKEIESASNTDKVECSKIITKIQDGFTLTDFEKISFDKECRKTLSKEYGDILGKVVSGEISKELAQKILPKLTQENAQAINAIIGSKEFKAIAGTDAADAVLANLDSLKGIPPQDLDTVIKSIGDATPQMRQSIIRTAQSIGEVSDPEARGAMMKALGNARSPEEIQDILNFSRTLQKLTPEEQKVYSKAFAEAPDGSSRKALQAVADEVALLDPSDKVRLKMSEVLGDSMALSPDKRGEVYKKAANVLPAYRESADPEVKSEIANAISKAKVPDGIQELGARLAALSAAGPNVPKDLALEAVRGRDKDVIQKLVAASELITSGEKKAAQDVLEGKVPESKINELVNRAAKKSSEVFSQNAAAVDASAANARLNVTPAVVKDAKEKLETENQKIKDLEIRITDLARVAHPTDPRLASLYAEMAQANNNVRKLKGEYDSARAALKDKLQKLRASHSEEFAFAGVSFPDLDNVFSDAEVAGGAPRERLTDLRNMPEFFGTQGEKDTVKRRFMGFSTSSRDGDRLLADATKDIKKGETWYAAEPGKGGSASPGAKAEFVMSSLLRAPGVMQRIPATGIHSKKASAFQIEFRFLANVTNRKTGVITIPAGSVALCKPSEIEGETGRLLAECDRVDTGGREDIKVSFSLGSADGSDGLLGKVESNRGWQLAGIFLTAFSSAVLEGFSNIVVGPIEQVAAKRAQDYVVKGAATGTANILGELGAKQVQEWSASGVTWIGYNGMLATVRQK